VGSKGSDLEEDDMILKKRGERPEVLIRIECDPDQNGG
jgi:hypothetical protein